ncbi:hypothetical protein Tco_0485038 [Tanacetum coccineum]
MQRQAKCVSLDTISNLPLPIIEIILCILPIKEAVRTKILSEELEVQMDRIPKLYLVEECCFQEYARRELPTALVNLKCISLFGTVLFDNSHLPLLCHVLRSSPNLEKITLMNLKELKISRFNNLVGESRFVKLILAKSPVLKKVILEVWFRDADRHLEILRPLLQSPRASPAAEIIVMHSIKPWNDYGYSEGLGVVNL